jgi:hypothetical protein
VARDDGNLYVRWGFALTSEPKVRLLYYPVGLRASALRQYGREAPLPLIREDSGLFRERDDPRTLTFRLVHGGATTAAFEEIIEVPAPKARGKDVRWNNGRWEKHLKREGWVSA